jgi:hypothetical protein
VEVKSDPVKWVAADGRSETQALQHRDALRHEAFTTRLFSRESCLFEDVYHQALAPEHDRKRGARDATPNDENIGHLFCFPGAFIECLTLRNFHQAGQYLEAQVADSFEAHFVRRRFCSVLHSGRTW